MGVVKLAEKKPLYKRTWFLVVAGILLISGIGNAIGGSTPSSSQSTDVEASPSTSVAEELASSPTPSETVEPSPTTDPNSPENVAYFISSSSGQFKDLDKDIDDAVKRAKNDQFIRLLGNILEFSFNFGQLEALEVPDAVSEAWKAGMLKLDASIEEASNAATDFAVDEASTSEVVSSLEKVRDRVNALQKIVSKLQ